MSSRALHLRMCASSIGCSSLSCASHSMCPLQVAAEVYVFHHVSMLLLESQGAAALHVGSALPDAPCLCSAQSTARAVNLHSERSRFNTGRVSVNSISVDPLQPYLFAAGGADSIGARAWGAAAGGGGRG